MRYALALALLITACEVPTIADTPDDTARTAIEPTPDEPTTPEEPTEEEPTPDDPAPTAIYLPKRVTVDGATFRTECAGNSYERSGFLRVDCDSWNGANPEEEALYSAWMRAYVEDQGFVYGDDFEIIITSVAGIRSATLFILIDLPYGGILDEVYSYSE
jgi:hypothetical protein